MRPFLRWLINGKRPKPTPLSEIPTIIRFEDPRTDALKAMAAALETQTAILERFAEAAESVVAALDRAEQRTIAAQAPPPTSALSPASRRTFALEGGDG